MDQKFDEAVLKGVDAYRRFKYCAHERYHFQKACGEFKAYLKDTELQYSPEIVGKWLTEHQPRWDRVELNIKTRTMGVLSDIMEHGDVTGSLKPIAERRSYIHLPGWCRSILDDYLDTSAASYGPSYYGAVKMYCTRFFMFLVGMGISQLSEITHKSVKMFADSLNHKTPLIKGRSISEAGRCLLHMAA